VSKAVTYDQVLGWVNAFGSAVAENKEYLTRLDSAIGDGDHGINMDRGMRAALAKIEPLAAGDIGALLKTVGMALVSSVGGAAGPLYGTFFLQLGTATAAKSELTLEEWAGALEQAIAGVVARGKAERGDKTMVDALVPGLEALQAALAEGVEGPEALSRSADAAQQGMEATTPLVARKGRASYLGERSAGHQDPGATSSHLLLSTAAEAWSEQREGREEGVRDG